MMTNKGHSSNCRLCGHTLPLESIFHLDSVPPGGQYFPLPDNVKPYEELTLEVYQCSSCGLVQLTSDPVIYEEVTTSANAFSSEMIEYRTKQMRGFIERFDLNNRVILDVGCGDGHLLSCIIEAGARGSGIDVSEKALSIARKQGLEVQYGYIDSAFQISGAPFDAFISTDVIEHVPDVRDFLTGIRNNLCDGAVGIIETPNFDQSLTSKRFYDLILDHLCYFTLDTLRLSLEMSGFNIIEIGVARNNENLTALVQKREMPDYSLFEEHRKKLLGNLKAFVDTHTEGTKRMAIWGASYQTLTLSTLTSLDKISYIIDSAPYKQGHLTPASHLPIVGPQIVAESPVDTILVVASRFSNEIIKQIKYDLNFTGTIADLRGSEIKIVQE